MWSILYSLRKAGYHFRRQAQIGPYYADFADMTTKLVIEVDGPTHGTDAARAYDAARNAYMQERGFTVLRFWNNDVLDHPDGVYETILGALGLGETPHPVPPPQGGRRRQRRRAVDEPSPTEIEAPPTSSFSEAGRLSASPPPLRGRGRVGGGQAQ